jgi:hypothetical protein
MKYKVKLLSKYNKLFLKSIFNLKKICEIENYTITVTKYDTK